MAGENILYLDVAEFEEGRTLRGGALVVDSTTEPLEFRCTDAVTPTKLQRILWGARLEGHIAANIVGLPLIKSIRQEFGIVVVRDSCFLALRSSVDIPVITVARGADVVFPEAGEGREGTARQPGNSTRPEESPSELLSDTSGRFEAVVLRCDRTHEDDVQAARQILTSLFLSHDVLEPFSRISTALEFIHREKSRG